MQLVTNMEMEKRIHLRFHQVFAHRRRDNGRKKQPWKRPLRRLSVQYSGFRGIKTRPKNNPGQFRPVFDHFKSFFLHFFNIFACRLGQGQLE
jgi:hypothetical protein